MAIPSLIPNDSTALTRHLVEERKDILADHTQKIDVVADESKQLWEALEKSQPVIRDILTSQPGSKLSQKQIEEMLERLATVATTDVEKLEADLKQTRQNNAVLKQLVQKVQIFETQSKESMLRLQNVIAMEEKSIQDLTLLRLQLSQAGLQATCQGGLVSLS